MCRVRHPRRTPRGQRSANPTHTAANRISRHPRSRWKAGAGSQWGSANPQPAQRDVADIAPVHRVWADTCFAASRSPPARSAGRCTRGRAERGPVGCVSRSSSPACSHCASDLPLVSCPLSTIRPPIVHHQRPSRNPLQFNTAAARRGGQASTPAGGYPSRTVGTSGNPERFRRMVHITAAPMMTTNAEVVDTGLPPLRRTNTHANNIGSPINRKALSTNAAGKSPCRMSWVIRSPPHAGQFHPVSALNGHAGNTKLGLCGLPKPT